MNNDFNKKDLTALQYVVNGRKDVIRDPIHPKYAGQRISDKITGTSLEERKLLYNKMFGNRHCFFGTVCGIEKFFEKVSSESGKTTWFSSKLTEDEYRQIMGSSIGLKTKEENSLFIRLSEDLELSIHSGKFLYYIGTEFLELWITLNTNKN